MFNRSDLRMEKEKSIMTREQLVDEVMEGIIRIASKRAFIREQREDFVQDGVICALEMFDRYGHKPRNELVKLTGKACFHAIVDQQKRSIRHNDKHINVATEYCASDVDDVEEFETDNFVKILTTRLSAIDKRVLKEKLEPSDDTIGFMLIEKDKKQKRREEGFLVMNAFSDKINNNHIAKSLKISKATVSRSISRIQDEVQSLMSDGGHTLRK
mgnify:CR=1 FL=1